MKSVSINSKSGPVITGKDNRLVSWFSFLLFLTNALAFIILFELFFREDFSYVRCQDMHCFIKNFKHVHSYYLVVMLILSVSYSLLRFGVFQNRGSKSYLWTLMYLFIIGFILYGINKYLNHIRDTYGLGRWLLNVFFSYVNAITTKYSKIILVLIVTTFLFQSGYSRLARKTD